MIYEKFSVIFPEEDLDLIRPPFFNSIFLKKLLSIHKRFLLFDKDIVWPLSAEIFEKMQLLIEAIAGKSNMAYSRMGFSCTFLMLKKLVFINLRSLS